MAQPAFGHGKLGGLKPEELPRASAEGAARLAQSVAPKVFDHEMFLKLQHHVCLTIRESKFHGFGLCIRTKNTLVKNISS